MTSETSIVVTKQYAYLKRYIKNRTVKVAIPLDSTIAELELFFNLTDEQFLQQRERN